MQYKTGWADDAVIQYKSMFDYQNHKPETTYTLPIKCSISSAIVYGGNLYCAMFNVTNNTMTNIVVKYNFKLQPIVSQMKISAGLLPRRTYSYIHYIWQRHQIDFAADETGLYVIYANASSKGNIIVSKVNPIDLTTEQTWMTTYQKNKAGHAFMVCGILYATNAVHGAQLNITYAFDTASSSGKDASLPIDTTINDPNTYILDYNPLDQSLYAWGFSSGSKHYRQVRYKVMLHIKQK